MRKNDLKKWILIVFAVFAFIACGSDDKVEQPEQLKNAELKTPKDKASAVSIKPMFEWDENKEVVKYELVVSKTNEFKEGDDTKKVIDITANKYQFANYELANNTKYFWKVVAFYKNNKITMSKVHSFTTVAKDLKIKLLNPEDKKKVKTGKVSISWDVEKRDGYTEEFSYSVFLKRGDSNFSLPVKKDLKVKNLELDIPRGNQIYYWAVAAFDKDGDKLAQSPVRSIETLNTLPTVPLFTATTPVIKLVDGGVSVTLIWNKSEDVDGEKLTYTTYYSEDESFSTKKELVYKPTGKELFKYKQELPLLDYNKKYWVKVVVSDEHQGIVESKVIDFTTPEKPKEIALNITTSTWNDTRDNNKEYKTVTINGVTWLAENYAYIPEIKEGQKPLCSVYGVDSPTKKEDLTTSPNYEKYGVLYSGEDLNNIAPEGWHVATDEEWRKLEELSGMTPSQIDAIGKTRGEMMHKFISETAPFSALSAEKPTNVFKLSVIYGGYYSIYKSAYISKGEGIYTYFWTGTVVENTFPVKSVARTYRAFSKTKKSVERNSKVLSYRMYVRLVKNSD